MGVEQVRAAEVMGERLAVRAQARDPIDRIPGYVTRQTVNCPASALELDIPPHPGVVITAPRNGVWCADGQRAKTNRSSPSLDPDWSA